MNAVSIFYSPPTPPILLKPPAKNADHLHEFRLWFPSPIDQTSMGNDLDKILNSRRNKSVFGVSIR